ncbi:copper homeostasis protein CutC [Sporosarcina sp. G11-34]|uniref:copper homeostasis protein CutC n=1 Tax=Sporosarcina sp. G11-34 TaxID=2849605 RepID=UPI0022A93A01|nr:copper homeostasis protein CutC [Sporosarcina sp. G11-34]MCZ2258504.1 copper homeostasis protein CutC [Sporosarcina sp. G11-34]
MILEVIATSLEDAVVAEQAGASRLELCAALSKDGLTPSLGLIEAVVEGVNIPVNVIVRPHNRGFHYTESDLAVMLADIHHIKCAGAAGIVIGALTKDNKVDTRAITILLKKAGDLDVTFHRAFDFVDNQSEALDTIAGFPQINRILTSGGQAPAPESAEQLKKLVKQCKDKTVQILAGNGVTPESLSTLVELTGIKEVHLGSGIRINRSFMHPIDAEIIATVKNKLKQLGR